MNTGLPPPGMLPPPQDLGGKKRKGSQAEPTRKRSKKAAGSDGTASVPEVSGAGTSTGTTPPKKPPAGRKAAAVSGKGRKGEKDDEVLDQLVQKDEGKVEEEPEEKLGKTHTGVFSKDLPWMMYGYGDAEKPFKETVDLVEDIAVQFITDTVHLAMSVAATRNPSGASTVTARQREDLRLEDLLFAVRRYPRQVARIQELIRRQQEIKDARKVIAGDVDGTEDMPADF